MMMLLVLIWAFINIEGLPHHIVIHPILLGSQTTNSGSPIGLGLQLATQHYAPGWPQTSGVDGKLGTIPIMQSCMRFVYALSMIY